MMNPGYLCYNSVLNIPERAGPTAIFVAGRTNRNDPAYQIAREKGSEVYPYFNLAEMNKTKVSALDAEFYNGLTAPQWGGGREGYLNKTWLLDIRPGSKWVDFAVEYIRQVVLSGKFDGVFLDVLGGRLWMSDWETWSATEHQEWRDGSLETVRRLRAMVNEVNPDFVLMNNNHWVDTFRKVEVGGERYVNGISIEGHDPTKNLWMANYAKREFGVPDKRRVMTINRTPAIAKLWEVVPGITHVLSAPDPEGYAVAGTPVVGYSDLRVPELKAKVSALQAKAAGLQTQVADLTGQVVSLVQSVETRDQELEALDLKINKAKEILSG